VTSAEWSSSADADELEPARSVDAEPVDAEPVDAEPVDAEPVDAEPAAPQSHPQPPQAERAPAVADLTELDTLDERPLAEHADVFGRVHAQLQAALAEVDGS